MVRRLLPVLAAGLLSVVLFAGCGRTADSATPAEVVTKVHEAASFLSEQGEGGLASFNDPKGPWVFKDTYVFVFDCLRGINAGQPVNRMNVGKPIEDIKDSAGAPVGLMICNAGAYPGGRWIEYYFPEADGSTVARKLTFVFPVAGTPYVVGAGIYGGDETIEDLNGELGQ